MEVSRYLYESLDLLGIGACEYDGDHRAVGWNRTFLHFFPEHAGAIHPGESYADNLRRFYAVRLEGEELAELERYVAEGVARHDGQTQPFEFLHCGRRLRASSLRSPGGNRVRLWQLLASGDAAALAVPVAAIPAIEALSYIPDGATLLDAQDRIVAANDAFRQLYDIPADRPIVGVSLDEIIADCWRGASAGGSPPVSVRNGLRYDGAPLELELPGQRWRRVIARHASDGIGCFIHADITMAKRQQIELLAMQEALRAANGELAKLASTDALTGLANRRSFMERLQAEAGRTGRLALLLVDVDHFKGINDRFGHLAGDACLGLIADAIAAEVRQGYGQAARIGGEEFALLLPGADPEAAFAAAEAIRARLGAIAWGRVDASGQLDRVTVSIGLCACILPASTTEIYGWADSALYAAKRNGRDRIECALGPGEADRRAS